MPETVTKEVKTIESLIAGCDRVLSNLDGATSERVCEDVEQLDHLHDRLAKEVENLAGLLRDTLMALQGGRQ